MRHYALAVLLFISSQAFADEPPIPQLATWESKMLTWGNYWCDYIEPLDPNSDPALANTFYDGIRVFLQISEYTGDTATWLPCAEIARVIYGDNYAGEENGGVLGYWNFSEGLRMDWEVNARLSSKNTVIALSEHASFCDVGHDYSSTDATYAREVAYCLNAVMNAEALGVAPSGRKEILAAKLLSYLDAWFVSKTYRCHVPSCDVSEADNKYYIQPFMVGLVVEALIRYWNVTADAAVEPAVTAALDALWTDAWVAADESMWYDNWKTDPGDAWPVKAGAPDLNQLIAVGYVWLYTQNADTSYRDKGDALFAGGAKFAELSITGKHFNQNYIYSFEFVTLRSGEPPPPPAEGTAQITPLDTSVSVVYGASGLPYETDCTVTLDDSGGSPLDTDTTTEGLARRTAIFTGLTAATVYGIDVDCNLESTDVIDSPFTTKATPAGGDRTVPIQIGAALTYPDTARAIVYYDDNAALSTPASTQNTSCAGACTVNLTIPAGLYYYRTCRQTSGDVVLACSGVQPLRVE